MKPTRKQLELLRVLNPFKNKKIFYREAAKIMGLSLQTVKDRMSRLKKNSPEVYWKFKQLSKDMNAGQRALGRTRIVDPNDFKYFDIKERF